MMESAGVPLVPGYHGDDQSPDTLRAAANAMGYPVLLKATAGGGGKGMRQVWAADEFDNALAAAKRESASSFGDDTMLVEKYLQRPRHVEVQVFCDQHGNAVYLAERDCSVQRRHQKVIEEAPAPGMTTELRSAMGAAAIEAARAIAYEGAGTVEFLLDSDGVFFFMEMNTRLQVEHPVTEMITGVDLVEWQLRVACGEVLPLQQEAIKVNGHAFEARIYAEDPERDFLPDTGTIHHLEMPLESRHVRVDTGIRQGDEVSIHYDPMIAKLIVWDQSRASALARLADGLSDYRIAGLATNIDFLYNLANAPAFQRAELDTGFIENNQKDLFHQSAADIAQVLPLATIYLILEEQRNARSLAGESADRWSPWAQCNNWRLNDLQPRNWIVVIGGIEHSLNVIQKSEQQYTIHGEHGTCTASGSLAGNDLLVEIDGHRQQVSVASHDDLYSLYTQNFAIQFQVPRLEFSDDTSDGAADGFAAPMNGTLVALLVEPGQAVTAGTPLLVMEAMKMEQTINAPSAGRVTEFYYQAGDLVDGGSSLLHFETDS
ncbi:MAG: 3-methylcrotonyl-CoA carboxylase alpha subunit [Halieaceae bacterium]